MIRHKVIMFANCGYILYLDSCIIASAIKHPNSYLTLRNILALFIKTGFWFLSAGAITQFIAV